MITASRFSEARRGSRSVPETAVFKVAGKIFALSPISELPLRISLKCDPGLAEQLRKAHR